MKTRQGSMPLLRVGLIPNTTSTDSTGGGECAAGSQPRVAWACSVQTCHSRGYLLTKTPGQLWKGRDLATLQRAFPFGHVGAYLGAPRPAVPLGRPLHQQRACFQGRHDNRMPAASEGFLPPQEAGPRHLARSRAFCHAGETEDSILPRPQLPVH